MAINSPTYDPASTAAALADKYISGARQVLDARTDRADATSKGLRDLSSALSAYQSALSSLTGLNKTMFAQSAAFSDTSVGTATATAAAAAGSYSFFVEKLATANQVSYSNLPSSPAAAGGKLVVRSSSASFEIDITGADADHDNTVTVRELAAAINGASSNSLASASVVTVGGVQQLMLTSKNTGVANAVTLDASLVGDAALKTALTTPANVKTVSAAQDAVVWLGAQTTGTRIEQATNTFNVIDGVKMTFTKTTTTPVTLTVAADSGATTANVQSFVDAYNKLKTALDTMIAPGDAAKGVAAGSLSGDSGIVALRDRLISILRPVGADSLANYGITANRQGTLSVDATRLTKALATKPAGLDAIIGTSAGSTPTGLAGKLDAYLKTWTNASTGQIKSRREAVDKTQVELTSRQSLLDKQYDTAYQRYLLQFTQLQAMQSQMSSNSSMFDALFASDKD
ncbi:flagellar filament capping protein FliD [Massilia sp. BKSP1R2A-1]|uniref:flagellar filament capping protein FliD n=1 Tax=Massilia sp. BKSP1R2A-1 TaxID=3422595 RepID=UPI003D351530